MIAVKHPRTPAREVWTKDEWSRVNRVMRFLESRGLVIAMGCRECGPVEKVLEHGRTVIRCQHKDRIFEQAF